MAAPHQRSNLREQRTLNLRLTRASRVVRLGARFAALWFACGLAAAAAETLASARDWPVYGGDAAGTKYSALREINRSNVTGLKPAWVYRCDDMTLRPASTIECNPIVVGSLMYLTSPGLKVLALEAATGRVRWIY